MTDADVALVAAVVVFVLVFVDEARDRFRGRSLTPFAVLVLTFAFVWVTR